jgi:hypothetical protein
LRSCKSPSGPLLWRCAERSDAEVALNLSVGSFRWPRPSISAGQKTYGVGEGRTFVYRHMSEDVRRGEGRAFVYRHMSEDVRRGEGRAFVYRHMSEDVRRGEGRAFVYRHMSEDVRRGEGRGWRTRSAVEERSEGASSPRPRPTRLWRPRPRPTQP